MNPCGSNSIPSKETASTAASPTVLCRCQSYEAGDVENALGQLFSRLGGIERFVKPSDRVLVKPNLIVPVGIHQPAQTHPAVIVAVSKLLKEAGARVIVGDSPAWSTTAACLKALDIDQTLQAMGIPVVQLNKPVRIDVGGTRIGISRIALEADVIINLPKFKAHQQVGATFAVKNMFGCVAGKEKALWHFLKGRHPEEFCRMLIGIYQRLNPALTVIDGIVAMEGQGPISGRAKPLGFLIGGIDPIACEYACCRLIQMPPELLPMLQTAKVMGYGCPGDGALALIGDPYLKEICTDFLFAKQIPLRFTFPRICKSIAKQAALLARQAWGKE